MKKYLEYAVYLSINIIFGLANIFCNYIEDVCRYVCPLKFVRKNVKPVYDIRILNYIPFFYYYNTGFIYVIKLFLLLFFITYKNNKKPVS